MNENRNCDINSHEQQDQSDTLAVPQKNSAVPPDLIKPDMDETDFTLQDTDAPEDIDTLEPTETDFVFNDPVRNESSTNIKNNVSLETGKMPSDGTAAYPEPEKKRKNYLFFVVTGLLILLVIAAIVIFSYIYIVIHPYASYDKIMPNVYCAGIDLSGMTQDEAQAAIEEALRYPEYSVNVILPDGEYTFVPAQEGIAINASDIAQAAYQYGRSDASAYGMYRSFHLAEENEYYLTAETVLTYSAEDILNLATEISQETAIDAASSYAELDEETHTVSVTIGTTGRQISAQTIYDAVCLAFDKMDFSDIMLSYETVELNLEDLQDVCQTAAREFAVSAEDPTASANIVSHTIELTMGTQGWALDADALYALALDAVQAGAYGTTVFLSMDLVEPSEADITEAYEALACDPTEPYYESGAVQAGASGYTLDWEAASNMIASADYGEHLSIAMTEIPPSMTAEELQSLLFRDQLSSCDTAHTAISNRTTNLTLACQAIDGTVINSGETFSFNTVVGERTAEKGYKDATVYVGDDSAEEIGGGVCQVASTIYDAALYAEMEITSREPHTFFVTYVPGGLDATIYWGSLDFCFKNTSDYPIRINASVSGGYVHISIDGTKTNDHVVKLTSKQISSTPYTTVYEYSSSMKKGTQAETVSPYTGYVYEAYQYIYDGNGNLLETNYLGRSTYKKRDRVITIGTG